MSSYVRSSAPSHTTISNHTSNSYAIRGGPLTGTWDGVSSSPPPPARGVGGRGSADPGAERGVYFFQEKQEWRTGADGAAGEGYFFEKNGDRPVVDGGGAPTEPPLRAQKARLKSAHPASIGGSGSVARPWHPRRLKKTSGPTKFRAFFFICLFFLFARVRL
jgi:hypothetical protein